MTAIRVFFPQIRALFSNFWKGQGRSPSPPSSYATDSVNGAMLITINCVIIMVIQNFFYWATVSLGKKRKCKCLKSIKIKQNSCLSKFGLFTLLTHQVFSTLKLPLPSRFNVKSTWCVCGNLLLITAVIRKPGHTQIH